MLVYQIAVVGEVCLQNSSFSVNELKQKKQRTCKAAKNSESISVTPGGQRQHCSGEVASVQGHMQGRHIK